MRSRVVDGVGGASNAASSEKEHHVLFGRENDGVYFEWDDQNNGALDSVRSVSITRTSASFSLRRGKTITVDSAVSARAWARFVAGVKNVFGPTVIQPPRRPRRRAPSTASARRA